MDKVVLVYIICSAIMSLIAFFLYLTDKIRAINGKSRIKEKVLLFFGVFFGSVGSLIGRIVAHHKTDKIYFSIVIWFSLIIQALTLLVLIIF